MASATFVAYPSLSVSVFVSVSVYMSLYVSLSMSVSHGHVDNKLPCIY